MEAKNNLVIMVDFNEHTEQYVRYAVKLAKDMGRSAILLNVFDLQTIPVVPSMTQGVSPYAMTEIYETHENEASLKFSKLLEKNQDLYSDDYKLTYKTFEGTQSEVIRTILARHEADMVCFENDPEGSHTTMHERVYSHINRIECPIWVIPDGISYKRFTNILYATDYNREDIRTIKLLTRLMGKFEPTISALHISDNIDFEEQVWETGFNTLLHEKVGYNKLDVKVISNKENKPVPELLESYAVLIGADLIVVLRENKGFLDRLFSRSTTEGLITTSKIPLLVYHGWSFSEHME